MTRQTGLIFHNMRKRAFGNKSDLEIEAILNFEARIKIKALDKTRDLIQKIAVNCFFEKFKQLGDSEKIKSFGRDRIKEIEEETYSVNPEKNEARKNEALKSIKKILNEAYFKFVNCQGKRNESTRNNLSESKIDSTTKED